MATNRALKSGIGRGSEAKPALDLGTLVAGQSAYLHCSAIDRAWLGCSARWWTMGAFQTGHAAPTGATAGSYLPSQLAIPWSAGPLTLAGESRPILEVLFPPRVQCL
jgi:hypothetical protein